MATLTIQKLDLVMLDPDSGDELDRCVGPEADGRCPRVGLGEVLPCAGCILEPRSADLADGYPVTAHMTMCPVTLALAMAVTPDTVLLTT